MLNISIRIRRPHSCCSNIILILGPFTVVSYQFYSSLGIIEQFYLTSFLIFSGFFDLNILVVLNLVS